MPRDACGRGQADRHSASLQEFRKVVLAFTRDNPLGGDLFNDEAQVEASFRRLRKSLERLTEFSRAGESWRRSVFDAREHVTFRAIETPPRASRSCTRACPG